MQNVVKTTGDFSLRDTTHRQVVEIKMMRPTVVKPTSFVQERIATGALVVLGVVDDEATQEELLNYIRDSEDEELAVAAFLAAFTLEKSKPTATKAVEPVAPKAVEVQASPKVVSSSPPTAKKA